MTLTPRVREHFEREAFDYNGLIGRLIPHYHEQGEVLLALVPLAGDAPLRALDLGAGAGILAAHVLAAFPRSRVVSFDLAENMLAACRANLRRFGERVAYWQADFACDELGGGYDLIVSGLAVHHLDGDGKRALFRRLRAALRPGGALLIRDIVAGATPALTRRYEELWRAYMRGQGEDAAAWFAKYLAEDNPSSVEDQLRWLAEAGFGEVACHWRYFNFATFGGRRPDGDGGT
jgi:tRNA (cmo5U34)-methyltransferase